MNSVIMHINYCECGADDFGKKTIDDICKKAADWGFDGIEFRGRLPKSILEKTFEDYAAAIAAAKRKYGLSDIIFGISVAGCASDNADTRKKAISDAISMLKTVNKTVGTTVCNTFADIVRCKVPTADKSAYEFHGSAAAQQDDLEKTADAYRQIGGAIEPLGMRVAFETHMNYIHDLPVPVMKLVNMIDSPAVGVNMDFGNTVYFPVHPTLTETIDIYGKKLFYTHLKNSVGVPVVGKRLPTSLAEGEINHREYLQKLRDVGFDGPIGIEAPRGGDREWFARQDLAYYKAISSEI